MTPIRKVIKYFEEILCSAFLIVMVTLVITNVFLRYVFNISISWSEEVATICFVWCVFIGASATYKHKLDMGIDLLVNLTPVKTQTFIKIFVGLILLSINAYIFYMAIVFTQIAWDKPTAVLGISSAAFNLALVAGFGLITLYTLKFLYLDLHQLVKRVKVS